MIDRPEHPSLGNIVIDEYGLPRVSHPVLGSIHNKAFDRFELAVLYLPYLDKDNFPEEGKFGGDSFSIYRRENGELIFFLRNGVGHGSSGRKAIIKGNRALENALNRDMIDTELHRTNRTVKDLFDHPDVLANIWNECLYRAAGRPSTESSCSATFGKIDNAVCKYALCGDVGIAIINGHGNALTPSDRASFGSIGLGTFLFPYSQTNPYAAYQCTVGKGTTMVLYSDGVVDSLHEDPVTGNAAIYETLHKNHRDSPSELIKKMYAETSRSGIQLNDDYTVVAIKIR